MGSRELPTLPAEALEIVARDEIDRARATKKLREVLTLACAGEGEAGSIRTISVLGSYARGAASVGDIDLTIDVDDPREERSAGLDDFYKMVRGENPDSAVLRALRCSGSSMVSAVVVRRFDDHPEPVSPENWRSDLGPDYEMAQPPEMSHIVTNQPLAGPSHLLYVRGDSVKVALTRLAAIEEDPEAARFERTTGVPMLDALIDQIGVRVQYSLAELTLGGGLGLEAVVLQPDVATPEPVLRVENRRHRIPGGKALRPAVLAAIDHYLRMNIDPKRIAIRRVALTNDDAERDILVSWGTMTMHSIALRLSEGWSRVLVLLRPNRKGPWIGLECTVRDRDLLNATDEAASRRYSRRLNAAFADSSEESS